MVFGNDRAWCSYFCRKDYMHQGRAVLTWEFLYSYIFEKGASGINSTITRGWTGSLSQEKEERVINRKSQVVRRTETNQDKNKKRLTKEPVQFFRKFQSIQYLFAGLLKMFVPLCSEGWTPKELDVHVGWRDEFSASLGLSTLTYTVRLGNCSVLQTPEYFNLAKNFYEEKALKTYWIWAMLGLKHILI